MLICPNCGVELDGKGKECSECGARLMSDATKIFESEDSGMVEDLITDFARTGIVKEVQLDEGEPEESFTCYECGKEITLDDDECPHCGIDIYGCPDCNGPLDPSASVCPYCNNALSPLRNNEPEG